VSVDDLRMRAGELACVCGAQEGGDDALDAHDLGRLAAGFGLSALAQALVLSTLPEASRVLAPTLDRLGWPYALLLVGAALATFPAAFLIDAFGRRSAFALAQVLASRADCSRPSRRRAEIFQRCALAPSGLGSLRVSPCFIAT